MSLRNPVKYPVKYYSWQDDQAPQLTDADGVIKTILKACLVTGYGSKVGAGWTALFEDDYRIVLRRPLRTGNPPDIKIENGVINSIASHRIVAQDNPASLDDVNELSAVGLFSRDSSCGTEWHCIVTDFAFLLCYQIGIESPYQKYDKNNVLFVGAAKKLLNNDDEYFFVSKNTEVYSNGKGSLYTYGLLSNIAYLYDMRRNVSFAEKQYLNISAPETYFNNDYLAQKIIVEKNAELPFFCAITNSVPDLITKKIVIESRPMLRYVNKMAYDSKDFANRAFYIPLDYWEL